MRVNQVDIHHVTVPFKVPYRLSQRYGTVHDAHAVLVRVQTDTGLVGWGEADPHPPFTEETPASVVAVLREDLGPRLIGARALEIGAVLADLRAGLSGNPGAIGAIDMALHDLAGKALGVPVHLLLGGALRASLPVMWPLGSGSAAEDAAVIEERLAQGYRSFMLKVAAQPVADDVRRVRETVATFGDRARFVVDANQGWSVPQALRFVAGIGETPLEFIEQPVAASDLEGLARVRSSTAIPISADESLRSPEDALRLVRAGAADVFSLKVSKNAGIDATRRIGWLAQAAGVPCLMNSMLEFGITQAASLALAATLPNLVGCGHAYMSTLRLRDDFTDFSACVAGGEVRLPEAPGLGVAVDEEKIARYARGHWRVQAPAAEGAAH